MSWTSTFTITKPSAMIWIQLYVGLIMFCVNIVYNCMSEFHVYKLCSTPVIYVLPKIASWKSIKVLVNCVKCWHNLKCCDSGNELHAFSAAMFNQMNCMDISVLHVHSYISFYLQALILIARELCSDRKEQVRR